MSWWPLFLGFSYRTVTLEYYMILGFLSGVLIPHTLFFNMHHTNPPGIMGVLKLDFDARTLLLKVSQDQVMHHLMYVPCDGS